ncbi:unnamed protein product, partial [Symbiodinium necroappetens]
ETMLSLFMSICGGVSWENVLAPLKSMSVIWVLLYLFYIAFTYFAVMNVVTAVFCQSAIDGAQNDHASKVHAILSNKEEHLGKIRALFSQFGAEDGVITFDLFREKIKSPEVRHYFQTLGLDVWDAWSFFKLLDEDAGGAVEIEEFLMGCLLLRGQATAMDVGKIINDQQWLIRNQGKFHAYMEVELRQLKEQVSILTGYSIALRFCGEFSRSQAYRQNMEDLPVAWPYRYQPHSRESVPCRLAPHHARLDHRAHYPFEVTSKSDLTSAYSLTDHNPYCYSPVSFAHRVAQRLLEGEAQTQLVVQARAAGAKTCSDPTAMAIGIVDELQSFPSPSRSILEESVLGLFASNPFPEKAPAFVRVTGYGLSPCSIAHHQKTGNWWHAQQLCEVVPPRQTDPSIWQRWVPHAECFHPEHALPRRGGGGHGGAPGSLGLRAGGLSGACMPLAGERKGCICTLTRSGRKLCHGGRCSGRPGSGSSSGCWPQRTCLRHGTAFARSENLRHLHRLHSVRACMPHRCPGDGPGHYQRSQAGGFVPASGGWKRAPGSEQVRECDAERSGLRWLQTLRDGLPHRLPEHSCLPS